MSLNFLDHICDIEDPRVPGMVLSVLVGLLCRAEDFDEIEDVCTEMHDWLGRFLPFEHGVAPAQTLRRTLARLDPGRLEAAFAGWTACLAERVPGVVAIDGKGALHLVSAYAHKAGRVRLCPRAMPTGRASFWRGKR